MGNTEKRGQVFHIAFMHIIMVPVASVVILPKAFMTMDPKGLCNLGAQNLTTSLSSDG